MTLSLGRECEIGAGERGVSDASGMLRGRMKKRKKKKGRMKKSKQNNGSCRVVKVGSKSIKAKEK